jgi:hypothetical protein
LGAGLGDIKHYARWLKDASSLATMEELAGAMLGKTAARQ